MSLKTARRSPGGTAEIEVAMPAEDAAEYHGPLTLVARNCPLEVPVVAGMAPPWPRLLKVVGAEVKDGVVSVP